MTQTTPSPSISLSVLIPNFNYARYIGNTIESVLVQAAPHHEIVVCDNASTDDSVEVVRRFGDDRIRLAVNACNVGFAANLERVAQLARGRRMLLLSSDDRMKPNAIATYAALEAALGDRAERAVWGSSISVIDSDGNVTGEAGPDPKLWHDAPIDPELSARVGFPVRGLPASEMLRRSLLLLRTPLAFATTCYSRTLHDAVGGYAGGRLINPDKWFLWKLLGEADMIYVVEHPLFEYRVHDGGQAPQEQRSGALKHLTDEYVSTFNLPEAVLRKAGLDRDQVAAAFVEQDIALRGLVALAEGKRRTARRSVHFGIAAYPEQTRANLKVWMLRGLLALGPVGTEVARRLRKSAEARWTAATSR
jgi:glycosyltransferase involved in cell wall biosynthesis